MPDPPHVGLFTRFVLENPYPLGFLLLALAVGLAWTGLRTERWQRLRVGGVLAGLGAAALLIGWVVVTSGEQARRVTLALVDAAVDADVPAARAMFAEDATLSFAAVANPGYPADEIHVRVERLGDKYLIESNDITLLRAFSESSDRATVHLACRTTLQVGFGPAMTRWVLRIERQDDGAWKVTRVTWVSIAGRPPRPNTGL